MEMVNRSAATVLLLCLSSMLIASEAYTPIAYGTKSRGMGSVGIANVQGAESGFSNPALLAFTDGNEVSSGGTYTKNDVNADIGIVIYTLNGNVIRSDYTSSESTLSPYLCANYHITDTISIGAGVTDYLLKNRLYTTTGTFDIEIGKTRVSLPVSYRLYGFSMGATLIYERMRYETDNGGIVDDDSSGDFGYEIGMGYRFQDLGLIVAIDYRSEIEHMFSDADNINSVSELGVGVSWTLFSTPHQVALEYKRLDSSNVYTDTSTQLTTQDQDVFAVGYMYDAEIWQFRTGYKYVSAFYDDDLFGGVMDFGMPFATTSHYTLGGSYMFLEGFSADLAIVYATYEHKKTVDGLGSLYSVENDPLSLSVGVNYRF